MVRWRAGCAGQHRVMQNETPKTSTAATFGRSSIAQLPPELREAVDAAIADGATIDEIADLIRGEGGACSRSAVGRYTKPGFPIWNPPSPLSVKRNRLTCNSPSNDSHLRADPDD